MSVQFKEKTAKVLVIESSNSTRGMITECLRAQGFSDICGLSSVEDAIGVLEVDDVHWIISSAFPDDAENGLNILNLIMSNKQLNNVLLSLCLDSSEECILPLAFSNGLFSCHPKISTKDLLKQEIEELMGVFESYDWNSTLTSAYYLRQFLTKTEKFEELLQFERRLMEVYPGDLSQIFNIVPPMVKLGKTDQAKTTLRQLKMMAPESADEVQKFVDEYLDGEDIDAASSEGGVNVLGLDKVVIVDSDDMAVKTLVSYLEELGVKNIETFEDGEAAFEHLSANPNADLIIAEWRIPKLTGPLFVQRLNKSEAGKVPVIISSSLIQSSDQALLKEMGVAGVLAKPSNRADFVQSILWVVQQEAMPTDQATMERKLRTAIKERNFEEIAEIKKRYMEDPNIPYGSKEMIEAEVAFSQGKFEKARDSAINALRYNGDSLLVLNLLGKTLMSLQQFDAALKFFEKAQNLSPQNLERLCQIAEVHSELGNDEEADSALEKAEKMDSGSQSIVETKAKDAMKKGDTDRAKALFSQLDSLENVVSYLNNQAVALARCDKFDQSFDHYSKAIASIPDEKEGLRAIVLYNLGLAYIRSGEMDKARDTLRDAGCHEGSRVYQKARILSKKVSKAIELNIEIKLNTSSATFSNTEVEEDIADSSLMDSDGAENPLTQDNIKSETEVLDQKTSVLEGVLTLNPNDLNLYLIYHAIDANNNLTDKMLATIPRFKKRSAIEREESGGADRLLASSGG